MKQKTNNTLLWVAVLGIGAIAFLSPSDKTSFGGGGSSGWGIFELPQGTPLNEIHASTKKETSISTFTNDFGTQTPYTSNLDYSQAMTDIKSGNFSTSSSVKGSGVGLINPSNKKAVKTQGLIVPYKGLPSPSFTPVGLTSPQKSGTKIGNFLRRVF